MLSTEAKKCRRNNELGRPTNNGVSIEKNSLLLAIGITKQTSAEKRVTAYVEY